jgi:hypothetical protein
MREHLPMIFPSFFYIDNYNLLEPEDKLDKQIPLQKATYLSVWPVGPDFFAFNAQPLSEWFKDEIYHTGSQSGE